VPAYGLVSLSLWTPCCNSVGLFSFRISTFLGAGMVVLVVFSENLTQHMSELTTVESVDVAHPTEGVVVATKSSASAK
jgi:hypothetical protein